MRLSYWLSVVSLVLLVGARAGAQDAAEDPAETEARAHFDVGRRLYDLGQFREAAAAFERAYERSPRPQLLLNIYLSYRDAAEPGRAAEALRRYLASDAVPEAERPTLERRLRALEAATVGDAESTSPTTPAPAPAAVAPDITGPAVLLAAGGALLVAGIITGSVTASEHGGLQAACPDRVCPESEAGRLDTIRTLGITTDVLLPLGGAAAAGGLIWLIVALSAGEGAAGESTASVRAGCDADGCGGSIAGVF